MIAYAAETIPFITKIKTNILNPLIIGLMAVALLVFLYGLAEMLWRLNSEEGRSTGQRHMIWGIIGLFIMLSAFGIMNLICRTIGCSS